MCSWEVFSKRGFLKKISLFKIFLCIDYLPLLQRASHFSSWSKQNGKCSKISSIDRPRIISINDDWSSLSSGSGLCKTKMYMYFKIVWSISFCFNRNRKWLLLSFLEMSNQKSCLMCQMFVKIYSFVRKINGRGQ